MTVPTIYLVDGTLYAFRAWVTLPSSMVNDQGHPCGAVYGLANTLTRFVREHQPRYAAVAFDVSLNTSFRNDIYAPYKANRPPATPDIAQQLEWCHALSAAMGFVTLLHARYEADDLLASVASSLGDPHRRVIASADKDLAQLVRPDSVDEQWDLTKRTRWTHNDLLQKVGVRPEQTADYLALVGDPTDNVPGVPGIGAKTAARLLEGAGSLEQILCHPEAAVLGLGARGSRVAEALRQHGAAARRSLRLTRLATEAPVPQGLTAYAYAGGDVAALQAGLARWGIGDGLGARLLAAVG